MNPKRIVLAGGSGLLGRLLAKQLLAMGNDVVVLSRSAAGENEKANSEDRKVRFVQWDAKTGGDWGKEVDGAFAVINLTGRSVNCRYNEKNRRDILESRVLSTRAIGDAIGRCANPPKVWLNASTATIYKHSLEKPMDEKAEMAATADAKDEFSVEVARAWEKALFESNTPKTRKVALRIAMVLCEEEGSVFPVLRGLVRRGLGGAMAGGKQYVAWIHESDFCRAIQWIIERDDLSGGVNVSSPNPITNRDMMRALRQVCRVPIGLPATRWMLEVGAFFMRTETELMLKSRRAIPGKLLAQGFRFEFPQFEQAARDLDTRMQAP